MDKIDEALGKAGLTNPSPDAVDGFLAGMEYAAQIAELPSVLSGGKTGDGRAASIAVAIRNQVR